MCVSLGSKLQTVKTDGQKIILNLGILIDLMKLPVPTQAWFLEGVDFKDPDTSKYSYFWFVQLIADILSLWYQKFIAF